MLSLIIPTYNEAHNVIPLVRRIYSAVPDVEIVFVDDNSPDGTADVICGLQQGMFGRLKLLNRHTKLGLASAIVAGFPLTQGRIVGVMDADLSHNPGDIPKLLNAIQKGADIAVGSRRIKGGHIYGWPVNRRFISWTANKIGQILMYGMGYRGPMSDVTTGMAVFRRSVLSAALPGLKTSGFKIVLSVVMESPTANVYEVPITFTDRVEGDSKMSMAEVFKFLALCWGYRRHWGEDINCIQVGSDRYRVVCPSCHNIYVSPVTGFIPNIVFVCPYCNSRHPVPDTVYYGEEVRGR